MKKYNKLLFLIVFILLIVAIPTTSLIVYAYLSNSKEANIETQIGEVKVLSVDNYSSSNKLKFEAGQTIDCPISVNLSCNVDAVLRVKIVARYFDQFDRQVTVPNNVEYNLDDTVSSWTSDGFDLCFYFNGSIKNISTLNFLSSITCGTSSEENYSNYTIDFIVEVDVLQMSTIDYTDHPWKDDAPQEWIDYIKNL